MSSVGDLSHTATCTTVPLGRAALSAASKVACVPAQSYTTSAPRPPVALNVSAATSLDRGSNKAEAENFSAVSRRRAAGSEIPTQDAPNALKVQKTSQIKP